MSYLNVDNWELEHFTDPYPHIAIRNFLKPAVYQAAENTFPPLTCFTAKDSYSGNSPGGIENNKIIAVPVKTTQEYTVPEVWENLYNFFTSENFFYWFCDQYSQDIRHHFPMLHDYLEKRQIDIVVERDSSDINDGDIALDFWYVMNSPVKIKSASRGAHIDNPRVLYNGLCYMRDNADSTLGGGHVVYRCGDTVTIEKGGRNVPKSVINKQLETVREVPYASNNFVSFLNTPHSVHAVGVREKTSYPRRHFQFNAVLRQDFFEKVKRTAHKGITKRHKPIRDIFGI